MPVRRLTARRLREQAAEVAALRPHDQQLTNGEESAYRSPPPPPTPPPPPPALLSGTELSYIANYTKGLPHNPLGEVDQAAYRSLLRALASGDPDDFERITLGTPGPTGRKLVNPRAGLAFELEGPDAQAPTIPPAPRIDGPENAAEMAELYWMALLRDVSFVDYGTGTNTDGGPNKTADAATSLTTKFTAFTGPRDPATNAVTPATLFRGFTPGDLVGPYVSQFLLKPVIFGTLRFNQRQQTAKSGLDYMMNFVEWRTIQNGAKPTATDQFDTFRRYIRNARDLATYVHFDALYEAYLNACLILLDMQAPFDPGNPYRDSATQDGFGTFGGPHILSLVTEVATRALKAVWYQKWWVHRRLRPEAFGGLIHNNLKGGTAYPINNQILDISAGSVLDRVNKHNIAKGHNTFLLPMAFPEGSPLHPAYGAGHATVAGACVTILKAWFDESATFDPNSILHGDPASQAKLKEARRPKVPNAQGSALVNYVPPPNEPLLTVGGELDKVAANVAIGRNMAGVHWRSDYTESVKLGEEVAIGILEEQKLLYNEPHSFTLTRFDGRAITL